MAKILGSSVELEFQIVEGLLRCMAKYRVTSDDLSDNRSLVIPLTPTQMTSMTNVINNTVIPRIKQVEGIS